MAPTNFIWRTFEWQFENQVYRLEVSNDGKNARFISRGPAASNQTKTDAVQLLDMPMTAWVALSDAVRQTRTQDRRARLPARAGKSWSQQECQKVARAFNDGWSIGDIARQQNRTDGAIISKLSQMGLIDRETYKHPPPVATDAPATDNSATRQHH